MRIFVFIFIKAPVEVVLQGILIRCFRTGRQGLSENSLVEAKHPSYILVHHYIAHSESGERCCSLGLVQRPT